MSWLGNMVGGECGDGSGGNTGNDGARCTRTRVTLVRRPPTPSLKTRQDCSRAQRGWEATGYEGSGDKDDGDVVDADGDDGDHDDTDDDADGGGDADNGGDVDVVVGDCDDAGDDDYVRSTSVMVVMAMLMVRMARWKKCE
eukprot:2382893-Pyramimonas_sp.AAC.1